MPIIPNSGINLYSGIASRDADIQNAQTDGLAMVLMDGKPYILEAASIKQPFLPIPVPPRPEVDISAYSGTAGDGSSPTKFSVRFPNGQLIQMVQAEIAPIT